MATERTFLMVKPDGVRRNLAGRVLGILCERGFLIRGLKLERLSIWDARRLYAEHRGKPFFDTVCDFTASGPVVVAALEREDAVAALRKELGATDSGKAELFTIRGMFGNREVLHENVAHGSATVEDAEHEIAMFWGQAPSNTGWLL